MSGPGRHAARPITPRSVVATVFAGVVVFALGLAVALPARQAYTAKAQSQELASKVLEVCQQGGEAAAPLVAISACPLAQQVQSAPATVAESGNGLTASQVQRMINDAIARQKSASVQQISPVPQIVGPVAPGLPVPTPAAIPRYRPAPEEQIQSTETARPMRHPPIQFGYPASREDRYPPERTVTAAPPATVTVTAPPAPAPPPVVQTVDQPAPTEQGVPLLNGVGGLLNGLGSGL